MITTWRRHWWLLPVVVLVLLLKAWLVAGMVQSQAQQLAADAAGLPLERVEVVDGLDVRMTGFTDEVERDRAVAAVAALDSSWDVEGILVSGPDPSGSSSAASGDDDASEDDSSDEVAAPSTTSAETSSSTSADADAPGSGTDPGGVAGAAAEVELVVEADAVTLRGVVASDDIRQSVTAAVAERFGDPVTDELVVDGDIGTSDRAGALVVRSAVVDDGERDDLLADASAVADVVGFDVVDEVTVSDLALQLNELFSLEPIEFDTARSVIRPESRAVLDRASELINANPDVRLLVVGHTDSAGDELANQALSGRRAEAVVAYLVGERGVDAAQLDAVGRGESEPKVSPEQSEDDRQRNRRIEWELVS